MQKTAIFKNGNSFKPGQCGTQKTSSKNKKPVRCFRFRLYPTKTQEERLDSSIEACRRIYNEFVSESRLAYKEGYGIKPDEMQRMIPAMIPEGTPLYSKAAQTVWNQFMNNIRVLHSLSSKGKKVGTLRFKPRSRYRSVNYNQSGFKFLQDDTLKLSKIGKVRCVIHRKIEGKIKGVIVKKDLDGRWFATAMCEEVGVKSCSLERKKIVGLDMGVTSFIHDSDGHRIDNPQILKKSEKRLRRAQRKMSGKARGSSNRHKQRLRLAKIHKKVVNQRRDFEHKVSREYVNKYDTIFVEDLSISNMMKNHRLARSIANASWNSFFQKLEYKAESAGILFRKVLPHGTSQECSRCGRMVKKSLAQRTHSCDSCGLVMDRDHNAAINIRQRGIETLPVECREVTPPESMPLVVAQCHGQASSLNEEANDFSRW